MLRRAPVRPGPRKTGRTPAGDVGEELEREQRNLFAVCEQLAARAATPATRRQYAAIYRSFGDWLRGELGRPPTVEDLDADAIAAYAVFLELLLHGSVWKALVDHAPIPIVVV